jgi:hypothetical protein
MDIELDNLSIADLQGRYSLDSRQSVYNRLKHLHITPEKGKISADQLQEMDDLHAYLQQPNAKMSDYPVSTGQLNLSNGQAINQPSGQLDLSSGQTDRLWLLLETLANRLQPPTSDPLAPQRQLEEIADRGWIVTTSQLRSILGVQPREGDRLGFQLVKVGRVGREMGWRVECKKSPV